MTVPTQSHVLRPVPAMTRDQKRLILWQAFITFMLTFSGGSALAGVLPERWTGLITLFTAALNMATGVYVSGIRPIETPSSFAYDPTTGTYVPVNRPVDLGGPPGAPTA